VALPDDAEEDLPDFVHYPRDELPTFTDHGLTARLIAGSAFGLSNRVKTHSPLFYLHAELAADARIGLPDGHAERAVYVVEGSIDVEGRNYPAGQLLVFAAGGAPNITAAQSSTMMMFGGEPLGPRHIWWNFVSSRKDRIEQAKADWKAGRIALPQYDNQDFIPLPEEPASAPEPEPMS